MAVHDVDPRTPGGLERVLTQLHMAPAHHLGQNFLVSPATFSAMAGLATEGRPSPRVLEIGPGLGGLTLSLLERGADVAAIELDRRVEPALSAIAARFPGKLRVIYDDALNVSWAGICRRLHWEQVDVAGNLPYYVTAPILGRLLDFSLPWTKAVFMVQKEVADRLVTEPGNRNTSALSVLLRYGMDVRPVIGQIAPESFVPPPKVMSSVIQLTRRAELPVEWDTFRQVVRAGFQHRRKMLRQALSRALGKFGWQERLATLNIASSARAEQLTLDEWTRLAAAVAQWKKAIDSNDI
ncbi:MAG: 16S rRNA (adenine(1518)-N(6)/adenine(1519)-N(6))-dimethyltransferase RsmA [Thermaerobacter sp.]|nr:16S rRNA (adenine(1518)-N(6)/adenine(1519)-N(6))-dimethyltransferase RsmA [Thermaerobacter sp.]